MRTPSTTTLLVTIFVFATVVLVPVFAEIGDGARNDVFEIGNDRTSYSSDDATSYAILTGIDTQAPLVQDAASKGIADATARIEMESSSDDMVHSTSSSEPSSQHGTVYRFTDSGAIRRGTDSWRVGVAVVGVAAVVGWGLLI